MENNTAENTATLLTTEPFLVAAIVEVLRRDMEAIELLLKKDNLFSKT
jgi:hypothetical protein